MKKLLALVCFLCVLNLIILVLTFCNIGLIVEDFVLSSKCDTVVNKVRIDSIEYIIKSKDSIINKIKYNEKEYIKKVDALDDDANVKLFKELVSK
jgi:hypothetical protein